MHFRDKQEMVNKGQMYLDWLHLSSYQNWNTSTEEMKYTDSLHLGKY